MKLFNKCAICYFHNLKSTLNDDAFKKYSNAVVFINLNICYSQTCRRQSPLGPLKSGPLVQGYLMKQLHKTNTNPVGSF